MKDMLLKIGREQVVLMSRVYALGSGWLLNTIQDIQSFLGSPATTKIEVKECDQDMKVDIEDIEVVPELDHQSNQHQLKQEQDNSTQGIFINFYILEKSYHIIYVLHMMGSEGCINKFKFHV